MKKLIIILLFITSGLIGVIIAMNEQKKECKCDEIKERQILTQLEIDLIHVKRVQQNWDRHLK